MMRVTSLSVVPVDVATPIDGNPSFFEVIEVNRQRAPYAVVKAAASESHVDMMMATTMPIRSSASVVEMMFFQLGASQYGANGLLTTLGQVMDAYDQLNLEPDPVAQATLNEKDKRFASEFPNMSVWCLPYGSRNDRAYLRFDCLGEFQNSRSRVFLERDRNNVVVDQSFWFGGVKKSCRPLVMPPRG